MKELTKEERLEEAMANSTSLLTVQSNILAWHEQKVAEAVAKEKREMVARVIELVQINAEGAFTDDAGYDCWYLEDLIKFIESELGEDTENI